MRVWKKLVWISVAALGTWAVAVLALSRGEQISALWIVVAGFCALSISYRFYSKWLATKVLVLNEERATPQSCEMTTRISCQRIAGWCLDIILPRLPDQDRWLARAGCAVWFSPWYSLDSDRCHSRWRRARHDYSVRLDLVWKRGETARVWTRSNTVDDKKKKRL